MLFFRFLCVFLRKGPFLGVFFCSLASRQTSLLFQIDKKLNEPTLIQRCQHNEASVGDLIKGFQSNVEFVRARLKKEFVHRDPQASTAEPSLGRRIPNLKWLKVNPFTGEQMPTVPASLSPPPRPRSHELGLNATFTREQIFIVRVSLRFFLVSTVAGRQFRPAANRSSSEALSHMEPSRSVHVWEANATKQHVLDQRWAN